MTNHANKNKFLKLLRFIATWQQTFLEVRERRVTALFNISIKNCMDGCIIFWNLENKLTYHAAASNTSELSSVRVATISPRNNCLKLNNY